MASIEQLQQEFNQLREQHQQLRKLTRMLLIGLLVVLVIGTPLVAAQFLRTNSIANRTQHLRTEVHNEEEFLVIKMGRKRVRFQVDGNLVIVGENGGAAWASNTSSGD